MLSSISSGQTKAGSTLRSMALLRSKASWALSRWKVGTPTGT